MPYKMVFRVDGGCRGNGRPGAIGAAAAVLDTSSGRGYRYMTKELPDYPTPTNQRAELTAIIMALEWALDRYQELNTSPHCFIDIYSDSRYAVDCMNIWTCTWYKNGWVNSRGFEVANRDLLEEAVDLELRVRDELGDLEFHWVPREDNALADKHCNEALDEKARYDSSSSDSDW
ncbi:hypothetical protein PFICI_12563 [Pestalotiopsis fici W106-1]|uniref:ribonuclease H n=1 Tax=Pestalotiopsis fici (strain W106-1 / CGMCC3.15140) TaxID=1229662 RepID=W3WP87_PESFW|nr:uncharacterized protein PFICI_12563 [Pestalotiopsis fici W106-1]ETS75619.1 hypothetical protein PFICI_12563 [Pestalotiopsis fici W106-1]